MRTIFSLLLLATMISAKAQNHMFVNLKDGSNLSFPIENIESVTWGILGGNQEEYGPDYIIDKDRPLTYKINGNKYNMILVEGGNFAPFYMMQTELPPDAVIEIDGFKFGPLNTSGDVAVTRTEYQTFLKSLQQTLGYEFRLPTREEWTFAASGGLLSKGYTYSGSNTLNDVGWYSGNSSNKIHDIATKVPNELGFYDMSGNYGEVTYEFDLTNGVDGDICGGCWKEDATACTSLSWKAGNTSTGRFPNTYITQRYAFGATEETVRLIYASPAAKYGARVRQLKSVKESYNNELSQLYSYTYTNETPSTYAINWEGTLTSVNPNSSTINFTLQANNRTYTHKYSNIEYDQEGHIVAFDSEYGRTGSDKEYATCKLSYNSDGALIAIEMESHTENSTAKKTFTETLTWLGGNLIKITINDNGSTSEIKYTYSQPTLTKGYMPYNVVRNVLSTNNSHLERLSGLAMIGKFGITPWNLPTKFTRKTGSNDANEYEITYKTDDYGFMTQESMDGHIWNYDYVK